METAKTLIDFQLVDIEILELSIKAFPIEEVFEKTKVFNITLNYQHQIDVDLFRILTIVEICNSEDSSIYATINCGTSFKIDNLSQYFNKEKQTFSFPKGFIERVTLLSISTTRGVIFTSLKMTIPYNIVLPIVNMDNFKKSKNEEGFLNLEQ